MQNFVDWIESTSIHNTFIQNESWFVPTFQTVHIFSIAVIFASVFVVALRILGKAEQDTSLSITVKRYTPFFWGALIVLAASGILLIWTEPHRILIGISFWAKMLALCIGVVIALALMRRVRDHDPYISNPGGAGAIPSLRVQAILTLCLWLIIILLGRFIAYDVELWGALSPSG